MAYSEYGAKLSGSCGIPEEMLREACSHNVCKVNVETLNVSE